MKSISVLLLQYFYHGIQCAKTRNPVHGEAFKVYSMKYNLRQAAQKARNLLRMANLR